MKTRLTWLLILMLALNVFVGCSDDDDDGDIGNPSETAFEVMAAAGAAYVNDSAQCPGVFSAVSLEANLDLYTVIDIRQEVDYLAGHIPGAYNSSLGTLLDDLANTIPSGKPYVVACYSGQSAGHAKIAMELAGYDDVHSLLFGMSSWSLELDSWTANCANTLTTVETTNNNADLTEHAFPTLSESNSTVVAARVDAMLAGGFKGIAYTAVEANPESYFIINYFGEADYEGTGGSGVPGHIGGAFQFTPYASMAMDEMLPNIPTDMPVVVYCWTGQHSSQITAYLNMLGYDAYSLKFGSNNLFYDDLTAHKWGAGAQNDFTLEMGYPASETFTTIATSLLDYVNDSADCPGVMSAVDLNDNLALWTVIDIRSAEHYNAGHIDGAYNSSLSTIEDDIANGDIPTDLPFIVACYTGQSAGHVKVALEMMGYEDTKSLLFGMSSWNTSLDSWTANTGNNLGTAETSNNNPGLVYNMYPNLDGETLDSRVTAMLDGGFKGINYTAIDGNLGDYFIINYFGLDDYEGNGMSGVPGHIEGAFQFTPYASMGIDEMLGNIPTDMPVVVYCWTGQHSSQITAYLNMLGYDAYSLKFGSNNLFYDDLTAHKWSVGAQNDFTLVPTPVMVANF